MTTPILTSTGPRTSNETREIMIAIIKLRGLVGTMSRNKGVEIKHGENKGGGKHEFMYTTADEQFAATLGPLEECGLAVVQPTDLDEQGRPIVWTLITHVTSGQWIAGRTPLLPSSGGMQGYNAALSSGRRVGFNAVLGLVSGDKEEGAGYDARKARAPKGGKKEQPSAEPYLRAVQEAMDVQAVIVAIGAGRHALTGWPSFDLIEAAGVAWFQSAIDATSEQSTLDGLTAALSGLNLSRQRERLAPSFRAAAGRVAKAGQVPT